MIKLHCVDGFGLCSSLPEICPLPHTPALTPTSVGSCPGRPELSHLSKLGETDEKLQKTMMINIVVAWNFTAPIHDPYLRSWGPLAAISLNLIVDGVLIPRSRLRRSLKPCKTIFAKKFLQNNFCKKDNFFSNFSLKLLRGTKPVARCCLQSQPHCCKGQACKK